jgi:Co/Zn/Cd efflux system component
MKILLKLGLVINTLFLMVVVLLFFISSLETFPTEEQVEAGRIFWCVLGMVVSVFEVGLWFGLKNQKTNRM